MKKILMACATFTLMTGAVACVAAASAFLFRISLWSETGEWRRLLLVDFIPDNWIANITTNYPEIQNIFFLSLNRKITSSLVGFGLILILIFLFLTVVVKRNEKKS